jgi:hypothetical protein
MSDRTHQAKGDRIQQLQQQIEVWQALLENERSPKTCLNSKVRRHSRDTIYRVPTNTLDYTQSKTVMNYSINDHLQQ